MTELRAGTPADHPALVGIWRRAVEATHHFLTPADVAELEVQVRDEALPALDLTVALRDGVPVGWAGVDGDHLEALFVDPAAHRSGVGRALLDAVPVRTVDVNEQNPSALRFYEALGFRRTGRSPVDADGRPFPVLHLAVAR